MTGTAASIIGVALAVFFYLSEQKTRDLTVYVHPIRTTVVKADQVSKLSLTLNGHPIQSDVTAAQIAIWNRGKLSIRSSEILKPIQLVVPECQILEASIRKQSRDIVNFRLDTSHFTEGRIPLNWDILEQADGAVIQLIYAGNDTAPIQLEGILEGQPAPSTMQYPEKLNKPEDQYSPHGYSFHIPMSTLLLVLSTVMTMMIVVAIYYSRKSNRKTNAKDVLLLILILALFAFSVAFALYQALYAPLTGLGPPFGF
jgi:hypothetical protein